MPSKKTVSLEEGDAGKGWGVRLERNRKAEMMDKGLARFCATLPSPPDEPLSDKAKEKRFDLICDAGVRDLATDAAESIQAQNSIEFMLAHQLAAAHKMAMHFIASAQEDLSAYINSGRQFPRTGQEAIVQLESANMKFL